MALTLLALIVHLVSPAVATAGDVASSLRGLQPSESSAAAAANAAPLPLPAQLRGLQAASATPSPSPSAYPQPPSLPPPFYAAPPFHFGEPRGFTPTLPVADSAPATPACVLLNSSSNVVAAALPKKSSARAILAGTVGGSIVLVLIGIFFAVAIWPQSCLGRCCQLTANCCPPLDCLPPLGGIELYLALQRKQPASGRELTEKEREEIKKGVIEVKDTKGNRCEERCVALSPELDASLGNENPSARGLLCTLIIVAILAMYGAYALVLWMDSNLTIEPGLVPYMAGLPFLNPLPPLAASTVGGMAGVSGVTLRFFVDGDPARCAAPLSAVSSDDPLGAQVPTAPAGATAAQVLALAGRRWIMAPPQRCGGSARQLSQLTFFCPQCTFTPSSALTLTLHYSCQSVLMEAVAVQAFPQNTLSFSRQVASAQGTAEAPLPLGSVQWTLPIIPTSVIDLFSDDFSKSWPIPLFRGPGNYTGFMLSASTAVAVVPQAAGTAAAPASPSPVVLTVQLPLASYIYVTTCSQLVELMDQLGTIVGFFPSVFGTTVTALLFVRMIIVFCFAHSRPVEKMGMGGKGGGAAAASSPTANPLASAGSRSGRGKSSAKRGGVAV